MLHESAMKIRYIFFSMRSIYLTGFVKSIPRVFMRPRSATRRRPFRMTNGTFAQNFKPRFRRSSRLFFRTSFLQQFLRRQQTVSFSTLGIVRRVVTPRAFLDRRRLFLLQRFDRLPAAPFHALGLKRRVLFVASLFPPFDRNFRTANAQYLRNITRIEN